MKTVFLAGAIMVLLAFTGKIELTGRWQTKPSPKGNITTVVFKPDNSFEGFINKKPFVSGKYTYQDNILSFVDNGCQGKEGVYKIIFFSDADSMRFEPIRDSCFERKNGMIKTVLGRIK